MSLSQTNKQNMPKTFVFPSGMTSMVPNVSLIKRAIVPTMWGQESRVCMMCLLYSESLEWQESNKYLVIE